MIFVLLGANFVMLLAFLFKLNQLPPQIPLFYSKATGDAQLADWWFLILIPILLNIFYALNTYVYKKFFLDNIFIKNTIFYLKLFLIISFTIIFLKIIFLIT